MRNQLRLTRIQTIEYEPKSGHYPPGSTLKNMMAIDFDTLCDDADMMMDQLNVKTVLKMEYAVTDLDWQTAHEQTTDGQNTFKKRSF